MDTPRIQRRLADIDQQARAALARLLSEEPELYRDIEAFAGTVYRAIASCGIAVEELCEAFQVQRSTVSRWKNGTNAPHADSRRRIISWITERITDGEPPPQRAPSPSRAPAASSSAPPFKAIPFGNFLRWPCNEDANDDIDRTVSLSIGDEEVQIILPQVATHLRLGDAHFTLEPRSGIRAYAVIGLTADDARKYIRLNQANPSYWSFDWWTVRAPPEFRT